MKAFSIFNRDRLKCVDRKSKMISDARTGAIITVRNSLKDFDDFTGEVAEQQNDGVLVGIKLFPQKASVQDMLTKSSRLTCGTVFDIQGSTATIQRARKIVIQMLTGWQKDMDDLTALTSSFVGDRWQETKGRILDKCNDGTLTDFATDAPRNMRVAKATQEIASWKSLFEKINSDTYGPFFSPMDMGKWNAIMVDGADFFAFSLALIKITVELPAIRNKPNRIEASKKFLADKNIGMLGESLYQRLMLLTTGDLPSGAVGLGKDADAEDAKDDS
jgi:hypothetical protein